jgi:NAD(P)H-dependent FMN reductase
MIDVAIILGSTRPGRRAEPIARWIHTIADKRGDARFELVDIAEFRLPFLDEPTPGMMQNTPSRIPASGLQRSMPSTPSFS